MPRNTGTHSSMRQAGWKQEWSRWEGKSKPSFEMMVLAEVKQHLTQYIKGSTWHPNTKRKNFREYNKKYIFKRFYLFIFREGECNINVCLPPAYPILGIWPATQACALTGNWTSDALVHRPALNPLSYTSQGHKKNIFKQQKKISIHLSCPR